MQPKAITQISIKPNQQVMTFFLQILARGDASSVKSNFQGDTQQYIVAEQETEMLHRCKDQNIQNQNSQNQF